MSALSQTLRNLFRSPLYTLTTLCVLALGLGVNLMLGGILHQHFLRPHDAPEPGRLVSFHAGGGHGPISAEVFLTLSREARQLSPIGAATGRRAILKWGDQSHQSFLNRTSASVFPMLGLPAYFQPEDDRAGGMAKVVLSHECWMNRFGGDSKLLNQSIHMDGEPYTVVGILPKAFRFPGDFGNTDFYVNLALTPEEINERDHSSLMAVGRMAPRATFGSAQAEISQLYARLQHSHGRSPESRSLHLIPQRDSETPAWRQSLALMLACGLFVLLISSANVANLSLTRWLPKARELALRRALGASTCHALKPLLLEIAVLAFGGGTLAFLFKISLGPLLVNQLHLRVNLAALPNSDLLLLVVLVGLSALFLAAPLLWALRRQAPALALKEQSKSTGSRKYRYLRKLLVITQVATASSLLVLSILLFQSLHALSKINVGFNPQNVLTAGIQLPMDRYKNPDSMEAFQVELLNEAKCLPGVRDAGIVDALPMHNMSNASSYELTKPGGEYIHGDTLVHAMAGDYLKAMGIPLLAGRKLDSKDQDGCLINERFAKKIWGSPEAALGQSIQIYTDRCRVVGVLGDVRHQNLKAEVEPQTYRFNRSHSAFELVVKCSEKPENLVSPLRAMIRRLDPGIPTDSIQPLNALMEDQLSESRSLSLLFGATASLALLLALMGISSALGLTVTQRRSEIGMRMALGAQVSRVVTMILGDGLTQIVLGMAIGLPLAFATSKLLQSQLYGVNPGHPKAFIFTLIILGFWGLLACLIPALKAARIHPMEAMRGE